MPCYVFLIENASTIDLVLAFYIVINTYNIYIT